MNLLKIGTHHTPHLSVDRYTPLTPPPPPRFLSLPTTPICLPPSSLPRPNLITPLPKTAAFRKVKAQTWEDGELGQDLAQDGDIYQNTLRLVECSMFAAISGLAYFLSNSLALENYFGSFFALPIVMSSMRWGVAGGRKTMVATFMLLFVLSGPVKALTYLLTYGLFGLTMGTLWKLGTNWVISIFLCAIVKALGAVGYVLISSFLIRENILDLITVNIHTSLTFIVTSLGINMVPSMGAIYALFATLLLLNCGFFVLLLHILYGVVFIKLGLKGELNVPNWLKKAVL